MNKKAFTLTELLVVVVIIGVLSAVVLPKFTKVMESRKTSEAEEMMSAVRNEQEARCTISKNYQKDLGKLASYRAGKNFTYADLDGMGMTATASSGKYTLKMPSYADGRICCDDEYCQNSLNKSYPKCSELSNFVAGNADCNADWAAEGGYTEGEEPTPSECADGQEEERACTNNCGEAGTQKNRCVSGHWQGWGACSAADKASCGTTGCTVPSTTTESKNCGCTNSGTKTRTFNQVACAWGEWGACTEKETGCAEPVPSQCDASHSEGEVDSISCECGQGEKTWHCGQDTGYVWQSTTTKECAAKPATTEPCPGALTGGPVTVTYGCYNGVWVITGKNIAEVCKNDEVDCVQLVEYTTGCAAPGVPGNGLGVSCSNYGLGAGSYIAVGAASGPVCITKNNCNASNISSSYGTYSYLTPGPTKKCKASQITPIKNNQR